MKKNIIKTLVIAALLAVLLIPSINPFLDDAGKAAVAAQIQDVFGGLIGGTGMLTPARLICAAAVILLVWLVATLVYFLLDMLLAHAAVCSMVFVYAVPVSMIVWLVFNAIWFDRRRNYTIISLLMWSGLLSVFLSLLPFSVNIWRVFLLGIPGQVIIWLWSRMRIRPAKTNEDAGQNIQVG
jgi:hypothetical protein